MRQLGVSIWQMSATSRLCASLIDAAQAEDGVRLSGDDFVRAIRRANLFVVSLDDEGRSRRSPEPVGRSTQRRAASTMGVGRIA